MPNFQDLPFKRNQKSTQHNFYSPVVRISNKDFKDNHFVSLKRVQTTENATNTNCFINTILPRDTKQQVEFFEHVDIVLDFFVF